MPYVVTFVKPVVVVDPEQYINDCCIGGDIVLEQLLPSLRDRYQGLEWNQEDWGWFIWFKHSRIRMAVDVHANDANAGQFEIHLTSRRPRRLLGDKIEDTPELEALRELVVSELQSWAVAGLDVVRVNEKYMPA